MNNLKLQKEETRTTENPKPPIPTATIKPRKRPSLDFSRGNVSLKMDLDL